MIFFFFPCCCNLDWKQKEGKVDECYKNNALIPSHLLPVLHTDSTEQAPKDEKEQGWGEGNTATFVVIADVKNTLDPPGKT